MKEHLQHKIFEIISEAADGMGCECYVIGGFVRDIFLKRESKYIDLVVVGSGIELRYACGRNTRKEIETDCFSKTLAPHK